MKMKKIGILVGILVLIFLLLISAGTLANSKEYLEKVGFMEVEIYFIRLNDETPEIEFIPVTCITKKSDDIEKIIRSVIITLLQGLTKDKREELNLETFIPEGTRLNTLRIDKDNKTVFVDFSKELQSYGGGSMNVICIRGQIEKTLKNFPEIDEVVITVEGKNEEDGVLQP